MHTPRSEARVRAAPTSSKLPRQPGSQFPPMRGRTVAHCPPPYDAVHRRWVSWDSCARTSLRATPVAARPADVAAHALSTSAREATAATEPAGMLSGSSALLLLLMLLLVASRASVTLPLAVRLPLLAGNEPDGWAASSSAGALLLPVTTEAVALASELAVAVAEARVSSSAASSLNGTEQCTGQTDGEEGVLSEAVWCNNNMHTA